eukprot:CAMPEP_0168355030 /NCGR_PEP_ID=MMETSP0213-20121227/24277_1 /TAXON_ID=151035 /ORGANISM="Euplotes harpa, Strain FSP1.4" /LENGTH=211 /DNA_ID=CAMNT_0008367101 /DNA_START=52 /DNA_END=685 /DNA_ORIENTATION=+
MSSMFSISSVMYVYISPSDLSKVFMSTWTSSSLLMYLNKLGDVLNVNIGEGAIEPSQYPDEQHFQPLFDSSAELVRGAHDDAFVFLLHLDIFAFAFLRLHVDLLGLFGVLFLFVLNDLGRQVDQVLGRQLDVAVGSVESFECSPSREAEIGQLRDGGVVELSPWCSSLVLEGVPAEVPLAKSVGSVLFHVRVLDSPALDDQQLHDVDEALH